MSANKAKRRASEPAQGVQQPAARSDGGSVFFARRLVSLLVDYVVSAGVVSIFYACAYIFYLDTSTSSQGNLMLLCAILFVLQTTIYVPWKTGASVGEHLLHLRVIRWDRRARTPSQIFVQECIMKVVLGPFTIVLFVLDYVIGGLLLHRDPDHEFALDSILKIHVIPNRQSS